MNAVEASGCHPWKPGFIAAADMVFAGFLHGVVLEVQRNGAAFSRRHLRQPSGVMQRHAPMGRPFDGALAGVQATSVFVSSFILRERTPPTPSARKDLSSARGNADIVDKECVVITPSFIRLAKF